MSGTVSHKLRTPIEGALAGGGDPATSPLYVFGPFLALIVSAGVADVTFGASIWLAVLTVFVVSVMYRLVMAWVVDGSGGSGLSEEEFGSWAVKVNAGITVVEFTLTFLVSMAALVTFLADRFPYLAVHFLGLPYRTWIAIGFSLLTGFLVNRGPRTAAVTFGPATASVLVLLWMMIFACLWRFGPTLPALHLKAFSGRYLHFTLAGYTRLLALITGIEVFANLVAAYQGTPKEKGQKAFSSLVIIMGTTCLTMLVVGPAIHALANPLDANVSVFTQTMDRLLGDHLAYLGTLVGVWVLLSACAASAQGLQNLALGLRYRHYIPASAGQRNRYDVAAQPVWLEVGVACVCFVFLGTDDATYLSPYAAGVFVLLSLTGWAAIKRLVRELPSTPGKRKWAVLLGTLLAAILTSGATVLIMGERFLNGTWIYFVLIPALYGLFTWYRSRLGPPKEVESRLAHTLGEPRYIPFPEQHFGDILLSLDGTLGSEQALPLAKKLVREFGGRMSLWTAPDRALEPYVEQVASDLRADGIPLGRQFVTGSLQDGVEKVHANLVVLGSDVTPRLADVDYVRLVGAVVAGVTAPIVCLKNGEDWRERYSGLGTILVGLDGSARSESVLSPVCSLAQHFRSKVILVSSAETHESEQFLDNLRGYLESVVAALASEGVNAEYEIVEFAPLHALLDLATTRKAELVAVTTHGRGGADGARGTAIGNVAEGLLKKAPCPVLLVPSLSGQPLEAGQEAAETTG